MNLLLVDDNYELRQTLKDYLEFFYTDIVITEATSGHHGLEIYRSQSTKFDIIISDEMMPTMTGLEFLSFIYHDIEQDDIVAVLYSGQQLEELQTKIKAYPAIIMVDKIAEPKALRAIIDKIRNN